MECSVKNGQVILTYEEDGSKWMFAGFLEKNGFHYMKLYPLEPGASWPSPDAEKFEVELSEDEYVLMLDELKENFPLENRVWVRPDPLQRRLDDFRVGTS
jgi:hypothetical protein